jgi:hypothetical protein
MTSRHYWRSVAEVRYNAWLDWLRRHQAIKLNMPTVGNPARFKLLVSKESLLHTQKFAGPKMNRQIDWKKFCSDPFGMAKKEVTE